MRLTKCDLFKSQIHSCWLCQHYLKLHWYTAMEVSFVSLLGHIQLGWWDEQWGGPTLPYPHQSAVETWCDMSNEEDPPYPTPISQQLRLDVTWAMRRTHPTLPPSVSSWDLMWHEQWGGHTLPPSASESWSDMSNEEDTPYPTPIIHQPLRVEVTWAMRRSHPILPPISHQQLKSWSDRSNEDPPYPPISHASIHLDTPHVECPIPLDATHTFGHPYLWMPYIHLDAPCVWLPPIHLDAQDI